MHHLPVVLAVCGAVLAAAAVLGWLVGGGPAAAGATAGVALVTASYLVSTLVIAWADSVHPNLVLPVGLTVYATKFSVLGMAMAGVATTDWAGLIPMSAGMVAGVLGWTSAQVWWFVRHPPALDRHAGRTSGSHHPV